MNAADRISPSVLRLAGYGSVQVPTSAGPMHVLEAPGTGNLPPILLLHGIASRAADWAPLLTRLLPLTRRVIVPDLPGHGASPAPKAGMGCALLRRVTREILEARLTEPAIVLGNSLGGVAAIHFAQSRPDLVRSLVLVSPGGAPMPADAFQSFLAQFHIETWPEALAFVDRFLARRTWIRPVLASGVRARLARRPIQEFLANITVDDLFTPHDLAPLAMPLLCLWGAQDTLLPPSHREFFRAHLPAHARFDEPRGYGHSPFVDMPEDFVRRVEAFARDATHTPGLVRHAA